MQVGVAASSSAASPAAAAAASGGARSVGQRIKDASALNFNPTPVGANGSASHPTAGHRTSRTTPLCSSGAQGEHAQRKTVMLTEIQRNTVRVIGQYLRDLGMNDTCDSLVEESGCRIESSLSARLREHVVNAHWLKALDVLEKLRPSVSERQYLAARVLLLEERFKELLVRKEFVLALRLLQLDYPKNEEFKHRQEQLAVVLMSTGNLCTSSPIYSSADDVYMMDDCLYEEDSPRDTKDPPPVPATTPCNTNATLKTLHKILPPSMMLPPARLQELLKQSWMHQMRHCELHVSPSEELIDERAILKNHQCSLEDFPAKNTQTLREHGAEVWCLEFSPCGNFLASGAKSSCVLIWRVDSPQRIIIHRRLQIPQELTGISSLSWSQDSKYLAIAATEENATGVFIYSVAKSQLMREYRHFPTDSFSVVSFFKQSKSHRLACGDQRGHFMAYDINHPDGSPHLFEGFRIRCLYAMRDGRSALAADTHNRIRLYNFESTHESTVIAESSQIMYFTVDHSERHCLVTTKTEGLRLWCLKTKSLIRSFFGSVHSEFVISSSFGGAHDNFIASGSEDEQIVIWNVNKPQPIKRLVGHTGTVNTVSWNPVHHGMLASGSDDGTIRIWSSKVRTQH